MGIGSTQERATSSTSLDNTLRVLNSVASEWYLLDIGVQGIRNGFGHGNADQCEHADPEQDAEGGQSESIPTATNPQ